MPKNTFSAKSAKNVKPKKELSPNKIIGIISYYATLKNAIEQFNREKKSAEFGSPKYVMSNQAIVQLQEKAQIFYAKHEENLTSDKAHSITNKLKGQLTIQDKAKLNLIKAADNHLRHSLLSKNSVFQFSLFGKFTPSVAPLALTISSIGLFQENKENQSVDSNNAPTILDNSQVLNQMSL